MKKFTSMLVMVLVVSFGYAQSKFSTAMQDGDSTAETINYGNISSSLFDCDYEILGTFENGYGPTTNPGVIWADDFVVNAGESFTLTQISLNVLTEPGVEVEEADFFYYDDTGNGPGSLIGEEIQVEITSQEVVGSAFGFDVRQVIFDMQPFVFEGNEGGETIYWIGQVLAYPGASAYFEVTSVINSPNEMYVWDEDDGMWYSSIDAFADPRDPVDQVKTIYGDCNSLSIENNVLSGISIFPNPTTDILNIQTPANISVESVQMFDILGKNVSVNYTNGTINTSALSKGVYILQVNTDQGTLTQKVVKQ